jgi:hypothetical protein
MFRYMRLRVCELRDCDIIGGGMCEAYPNVGFVKGEYARLEV